MFAWWLRDRGRVGVIAAALLALDTFAVVHGRDARMYAGMEFIGVGAVVLASAWWATPRRWHAVAVGFLVLAGLLTHVSMFLAGFGLLVFAGRRTDRAAWEWRAGLAAGLAGWAVVWGTSFASQAQGGHSSWIGPTTPASLIAAVGRVVTSVPPLYVPGLALMAAGASMLWRRDRVLFRLWAGAFAVPVVGAAVAGIFAPIVLERTFAVVMWGPVIAVAYLVDGLISTRRRVGIGLLAVLLGFSAWTTVDAMGAPTRPDVPLRRVATEVRPGDLVVIHPAAKRAELDWTLGVRGKYRTHTVSPVGLPDAAALRLGAPRRGSKVWVLDWWGYSPGQLSRFRSSVPPWTRGRTRVLCLTPGLDL